MKQILVIATGGTIACRSTKNGLVPQIDMEDFLNYVPQIHELCELHAIQLMNLDSTNMQPKNWLQIVETVKENYEKFDGFVILHGTDTLAYTAAALSYLIQNSQKPIVLTGAQKPIDEDISDAKSNLIQSILYATSGESTNVSFVFDGEVIAGTRGRKVRSKSFNAFSSVNFPHKAVVRDNKVFHYIEEQIAKPVEFYEKLNERVFVLHLIPGMTADILDYLKPRYEAIVIEGFGVGGIPSCEELKFKEKMDELLDAGMEIVITTQVPMEGSNLDIYEVGRIFKQNKRILEAYDMTIEAIVTKLMWILAISHSHEEVRHLFYTKINYDIER
ncbi:MAG: asparaginase [Lachnospiraceae bacterium]